MMDRLQDWWSRLGGRLGLTLCLAGFAGIWLGWNGAASYDRVEAQIPYLVAGGFGGLGLVVVGAALVIADAHRQDRADLEATLRELAAQARPVAVTTTVPDGTHVLAGRSSYHRPDCRLARRRPGVERITADEAATRGLTACRVCEPA
jgi:hypothetical protein